jgi:hypothetical protein
LLSHFLPQLCKTGAQLGPRCVFGPTSRAHDQIDTRQLVLMQTERLTDEPAQAVTPHAPARGANRNRKTETRATLVIQERSHAKESIT